jgi:multidrug efflux pump subunit AcrB
VKGLIQYFIDRSLIVNLFTVFLIIVGSYFLVTLQKEMFEPVDFDVILVTTAYPGTSAEDVEKLVTISLEREIKNVEGIKKINALSGEGSSIIYVEVEPDADLDEVYEDVKNAVDGVGDLPDDAKLPKVTSLNNKAQPIIQVALTAPNYDRLRVVSKRLRDVLEQSKGVARADFGGYEIDEIRVEVDPDKINDYEITLLEVSNAISETNLNLSAGKITPDTGDISIRTLSEFANLDDIRNVVIRSNATGQKVVVSDVAKVVRGPNKEAMLMRSDSKQAIFLGVKAKENADILQTTDGVKLAVEKFFEEGQYKGINYTFSDDLSFYVRLRLNVLKDNGLLGMGLVLICLMFFLNPTTSIITSLGAPLAFMVSFIAMDMMGISLNLISMFALILVLGMLVDDSIIVAEHFYQKLEKGMDPKKAAFEAAIETIKPVSFTIITTIIAFGALFFMGGIMGKFLWPVPAVVIICLIASWIECFFILPSHLADFCRIKPGKKKKPWYDKVKVVYRSVLKQFLKVPWLIVITFAGVFVGSLILASNMRFELFPGDDVRIVFVQVKGPVGTSISKTSQQLSKLEDIVLKDLRKNEKESVRTTVGMIVGEHGNKRGSHYGSMILYLTDPQLRDRTTDEIISSMKEKSKAIMGDYNLVIRKVQGGPPSGKPIEVDLKADNLEELKVAAKEIKAIIAKQEGVTSTEIDFEEGKQQIVIDVDKAEAKRLGLSTRQIAFEFRRAFAGDAITEIREADEDVEIKVLLNEESRATEKTLRKLFVLNNQGNRISLNRVVKFGNQPGAFIIRRKDTKRIISVSGSIDKEKTTPLKLVKDTKEEVGLVVKKFPGMTHEFGGENERTQESLTSLFVSFGIAIFSIYIVLVLMFNSLAQPVVIMSAIPLGLIGVVLAFFAFGKTLGFMALMGVVGLVGVVVNDSIVLVNFINKTTEEIDNLREAVLEASVSRLRPVLLTTFTTVAGLLPVAHAEGGDVFIKPMALSFAWGLLFATVVTLIFIPCMSYIQIYYGRKLMGLLKKDNESPGSGVAQV